MIAGHLAGRTWLHAVPARAKLLALAFATMATFWIDDARALLLALIVVLAIYGGLGREARARLRLFAPLAPILIVIGAFQFWSLGAEASAAVLARLCLMILLADLVTMTTPMLDMMDAIEPAMKPLRLVGLEPAKIALAVALVLRFAPALMEEWRRRDEAWRARTGRRASLRLLAPFLGSVLRLADQVAEALDARGFGRRRT